MAANKRRNAWGLKERDSAILLHISSLPSGAGIGTLGQEAYAFVDFLKQCGCTVWQMLPIGPTGFGDSPYQSASTHAGNPLFVDCETLVREGLLDAVEPVPPEESKNVVHFEAVRRRQETMLARAFALSRERLKKEVDAYRNCSFWVEDYALFTALKELFEGAPLWAWPDGAIRRREPDALARYRSMLEEQIEYHIFVQYLFHRQWENLRSYCNDNGIRLLGDIPIYVAGDSADVWADPGMFQVDGERRPVKVAGVPPDYFSEDGQLWGNPCYQWKAHKKEGYAWWVQRMWSVARRFDMVRLDHFIGFARYYAIEAGAPNAREGTWEKGPGKGLFRALRRKVPGLQIIAEDLGVVSPAVKRLLKWSGFPGMQVLQFAFEGKSDDPGLPDNVGENCAYYTGTHDNDTTLGWIHSLDGKHRKKVRKALKIKKDAEILPAMIQSVLGSRAKLAAIPMQDYLGLDTEARMNLPGSVGGGNWRWRMEPGAANDALARRIAELNRKTGRGRKT